jgi:stage II sporulation SpoAA-like protein
MLEKIPDVPDGIDALKAVGTLTKEDYERAVEPILDEARRRGRRIRLLVQVGPEYEGFTAGMAWEKAATGLRSFSMLRLFDGYAIVSDAGWIREWTLLVGFLLPFPLRVFANDERDEAIAWLSSLPEAAGLSHRLLPESGVIVAEVSEPLRAQDFDALAATAQKWLETHDGLQGIVLHARKFPGWQNTAALRRHVRFVRDHQRKLGRIAVATNSRLAEVAPRVARHVVQPDVKAFGYDELDRAISWAAGSGGERATASEAGPGPARSGP